MLALPLPILTFVLSAVACVLMWRFDLGNRLARGLFTTVFGLIAVGTLLVGLRFGYGLDQFVAIQRIVPLFVGPTIYLGFLALINTPSLVKRRAWYHLSAAALAAALPQAFPLLRVGYDVVIGVSYLAYCIAVLLLWRKGTDSMTHAPLNLTSGLREWMLCAAGMLGIMLVFDTGIAISFALQRSDDAIRLISIGSFLSALSLIAAIFVFSKGAKEASPLKTTSAVFDDSIIELEETARGLLYESKLYLDTELTLERLAKRLHVPARALSEAINQTQEMNVSQYVNGFRLQHAATLLKTTDLSVTRILEQSGFLSRSNFYREFERAFSLSPNEFRKQEAVRPSRN